MIAKNENTCLDGKTLIHVEVDANIYHYRVSDGHKSIDFSLTYEQVFELHRRLKKGVNGS